MSKKARLNHRRGWGDYYMQYGFALLLDKDGPKGQCVICCEVVGNELF